MRHACGMGVFGFQVFQHQLQLVGQQPQPLGRLAERHTAQARQLNLELLNLERGQLDRAFASSCSRVV